MGPRARKESGANTQAVPCSASYALNTQVTLTAQPDAGSSFSGWFGGGCSGVGTCQVTLNNAKVVMAMFSKPASGFTVSYYHTDRLGSVRAMTDASGALVGDRHDYAPFGEDTASLTGNPMRFGGKELDAETALHYFEARYYRQTWGRFTQVDPLHVGAAMLDPQQWNRYAYARNNPLAYSDFAGLQTARPCGEGRFCQDTYLSDNGFCLRVTGGECVFVDFENYNWSDLETDDDPGGGYVDPGGGGFVPSAGATIEEPDDDGGDQAPTKPQTPPVGTPAEVQVIVKSLQRVEDRLLTNPSCGNYFAGGASGAVELMRGITFQVAFRGNGSPTADTVSPTHVYINRAGDFWNPQVSSTKAFFGIRFGMTAADVQDSVIIHEMKHAENRIAPNVAHPFPPDGQGAPAGTMARNHQGVLTNCF